MQEPEDAEDESRYEFGLSQLILKPYAALSRCYRVWKYGEEHVLEMEQECEWEENAIDEYTFRRSNVLARAVFLFMT